MKTSLYTVYFKNIYGVYFLLFYFNKIIIKNFVTWQTKNLVKSTNKKTLVKPKKKKIHPQLPNCQTKKFNETIKISFKDFLTFIVLT